MALPGGRFRLMSIWIFFISLNVQCYDEIELKKNFYLGSISPISGPRNTAQSQDTPGGNNFSNINTKLPNFHLSSYLTCSCPPPHLVLRATHALSQPPDLFLSHTSPSPQTASPPFSPSLEMVRATEQLVETRRREAGCASAWVAGAPL